MRFNLIILGLAFCFFGCANDNSVGISQVARRVEGFAEFARSPAGTISVDSALCDSVCKNRRQEFRYVTYIGKEIYCYWDLRAAEGKVDFNFLASNLEQSITTQTTYSQYYRILWQWASSFHDGHVNVLAKSDITGLEIYTGPIRVEVLAPATDHEKVIVIRVNSGVTDVAVGDQITAVNGVAVSDALTKVAAEESSGSTERMRRYWAGKRLVDVLGIESGSQPLSLALLDSTGKIKNVSLSRTVEIDPLPSNAADPIDTGIENYSAKILPGGWGYFRLDGFGGTQDDALISQTMDRLSGTAGLILDLRNNGGGDLSGDRVIERLIDTSVIRYKRSERLDGFILAERASDNYMLTPDSSGNFSLWHDLMILPLKGHRYTKPVVALISPHCFSACDTFAVSLKANSLATFVGEPTGGGTGTPLVFDLPYSPLSFRYAVIRGQSPKGTLIEGVGTQPDVFIEPTVEDRIKNHDSQLAKAIEVLQSLAKVPATPVSIESVTPTWIQELNESPTSQEMNTILKFSTADSIGG